MLDGLSPLSDDAGVAIVGGICHVDALVVLLGVPLDSLDSLLERRGLGLAADGPLRCGRVVTGGCWLVGKLCLAWGADAVVGFPCGLDVAVVLLVFLSNGLKAVLHGFGGDGAGAEDWLVVDGAWEV